MLTFSAFVSVLLVAITAIACFFLIDRILSRIDSMVKTMASENEVARRRIDEYALEERAAVFDLMKMSQQSTLSVNARLSDAISQSHIAQGTSNANSFAPRVQPQSGPVPMGLWPGSAPNTGSTPEPPRTARGETIYAMNVKPAPSSPEMQRLEKFAVGGGILGAGVSSPDSAPINGASH